MTDKTIYFVAGLPRSGSTLLTNLLAQNPRMHATPTSGIIAMLVAVRNGWDQNEAFRAMERGQSEATKARVLRAMLQALPQPRPEISPYAPKLVLVMIDPDSIGKLIGPVIIRQKHRDGAGGFCTEQIEQIIAKK